MISAEDGEMQALELISEYCWCVRDVFPEICEGMTPKTSRSVHSVGMIASGCCMKIADALHGASNRASFVSSLDCIKRNATWTLGY